MYLAEANFGKSWAILSGASLASYLGSTYLLAGYWDWSPEFWTIAVAVPVFQAVLLQLIAQLPPKPDLIRGSWRSIRAHPAAAVPLLVDVVLLAVWMLGLLEQWPGPDWRTALFSWYLSLKSGLLAIVLWENAWRSGNSVTRAVSGLLGVFFLGLFLENLSGWIGSQTVYQFSFIACAALGACLIYQVGRELGSVPALLGLSSLLFLACGLIAFLSYFHRAEMAGRVAHFATSVAHPAISCMILVLAALWHGIPLNRPGTKEHS